MEFVGFPPGPGLAQINNFPIGFDDRCFNFCWSCVFFFACNLRWGLVGWFVPFVNPYREIGRTALGFELTN